MKSYATRIKGLRPISKRPAGTEAADKTKNSRGKKKNLATILNDISENQ